MNATTTDPATCTHPATDRLTSKVWKYRGKRRGVYVTVTCTRCWTTLTESLHRPHL